MKSKPGEIEMTAKRVLIVEDEPLVAIELQAILEEAGHTVVGPAMNLARGLELARNGRFDMALLDMAKAAGAVVIEGHAITGVAQHHDHVEVTIEHHAPLTGRHLIAADGMWSPVRKALGLHQEGYLGEWHAFRQYARKVTGPAAHRLYVWFEPDFLPGYAWSFPLPYGRANIGYGVMRDGTRTGKDMKAEWAGLIDRPHIRAALGPDAELEDRHTAWPIPAGIDKATLTSQRVLFVGDAARATDVMTGEGIGQAILTGRLAAEAIVAGIDSSPAMVNRHYERAVRHHLFADARRLPELRGRVPLILGIQRGSAHGEAAD